MYVQPSLADSQTYRWKVVEKDREKERSFWSSDLLVYD